MNSHMNTSMLYQPQRQHPTATPNPNPNSSGMNEQHLGISLINSSFKKAGRKQCSKTPSALTRPTMFLMCSLPTPKTLNRTMSHTPVFAGCI
jgi:hypothetical protein